MTTILGIDTAWTATEPSGVALSAEQDGAWEVLCAAPSYDSFLRCARGEAVDWRSEKFEGSVPSASGLLNAAKRLAGAEPSLVALDLPLATVPFSNRRVADQAISRAFGAKGCSTHSPSAARPGPLGVTFLEDLTRAGYPLLTAERTAPDDRGTIEVFPHPALLALLSCDYRVPYKVNKSLKYWKNTTVAQRIANLLAEFQRILDGLSRVLESVPLALPTAAEVETLSHLKRYEDALDALVSAWVGWRFAVGRAVPYGDETAAIWVPRECGRDG